MITLNEEELQAASSDELVEQGLGLLVRGIFRKGDKNYENNPSEAVLTGESIVSILNELVRGYRKKCVE